MKLPFLAGSTLAGLLLTLVGCNHAEPEPKPEAAPAPVSLIGPAAEPGPIQPSMLPILPSSPKDFTKAGDEVNKDGKEGKPETESLKDVPKIETPKK